VDGTILETPNYKKPSVRRKLRAPVYPVREAGGLFWVYLGPRDKEPPFPHYRFMDVEPLDEMPLYHATFDCSWVQMLEGTIDPSHANILHQDTLGKRYTNRANVEAGDREMNPAFFDQSDPVAFVAEDNAPRCEVEATLFGCHGVAIFDAVTEDGRPVNFARPHAWVMPWLAMPSPLDFVISVPIDDHHTTFFALRADTIPDKAELAQFVEQNYTGPASSYVGYHYRWGEEDRWGQNRAEMSESFTGIAGTVPEDLAMTMSMGPIFDRSRENLVPADQLVIRMRRRLLQAARELQDGDEPFMLAPEDTINLGGRWRLLSDPSRWQETLMPTHEPFRVVKSSAAKAGSST
jgi:phthalate 4,5-dioxygenase